MKGLPKKLTLTLRRLTEIYKVDKAWAFGCSKKGRKCVQGHKAGEKAFLVIKSHSIWLKHKVHKEKCQETKLGSSLMV